MNLNHRCARAADLGTPAFVERTMERVEIYTSPLCGYCQAAKRLLKQKGVSFSEYDVLFDAARKRDMLTRSDGRHTVPQIFIDGKGVGGYDELVQLDLHDVLRTEPKLD